MKIAKFAIGFGLILFLFLFGNIKALALTTETIYSDFNTSTCALSNSGKYKNIASDGTLSTKNINTTYNGKSYGMSFAFEENMLNTQVYNLKITFMADDLLPRVNSNFIILRTYDTSCEVEYATVLSIEKNTSSGNATTLTINFIPNIVSTKAYLIIGSEVQPTQITGETTFGIKKVEIGDQSAQGNEQIITNNNQNTQNIINNNNNNTQNIIDNQNQIAEQQHEDQQVCNVIDKNNVIQEDKYLTYNGNIGDSNGWGITDYIDINKADITFTPYEFTTSTSTCFYDSNKTLINCYSNNTLSTITIPNNSYYMRLSLLLSSNTPRANVCKNGNQALSDSINDLNDSINDDDIGGATGDAGDFITGFDTNTFGLTAIVTAPLNLIQSLTSSSCSNLELPLPFLENKKLSLPCMTPIYQSTFGNLFTMYQTITFGIIAYWVCVRIFNMVKEFKNPEHDEIEVVDL